MGSEAFNPARQDGKRDDSRRLELKRSSQAPTQELSDETQDERLLPRERVLSDRKSSSVLPGR